MATFYVPILGWNTKADASGRAYFAPYTNYATNDNFDHLVLNLENPSTNEHGVYGAFTVPNDYGSTTPAPMIRIIWTTQTVTNTVVFAFDYRSISGNDTASLDQATFQEQVDIQDIAPSATDERMNVAAALTDNFNPDDTVEFYFYRDGNVGGPDDDLADDVQVFELIFQYDDV